MKNIFTLTICVASILFGPGVYAQATGALSKDEYKKAIWMTTRMYGGQRSGLNNWYIYDHLDGKSFMSDKDGSVDLSGGWHDAGDFVKFGHTQFYAGYILLKGYSEFPAGYDDHYSYDYANYKSGGKWNWADNAHKGNSIPDIIEEVKHATDFYIKSTPNANTFYYQIGTGAADHAIWKTSPATSQVSGAAGTARQVFKNPQDGSMAAQCGAALAIMARIYKGYDAAYAKTCLDHAVFAYEYAKAHKGQAVGDGINEGTYGKNSNPYNEYASLLCELYWATKEDKYKTEALALTVHPGFNDSDTKTAQVYGNRQWGFDYSNTGELSLYNLALLGNAKADSSFKVRLKEIAANVNGEGLFAGGNTSWGPLRYNANTAWLMALGQKLAKKTTEVPKFIYSNIDWLFGKNSAGQSFVVGFGSKFPNYPHHKNIYKNDNGSPQNPGSIPSRNRESGLLIGGTRSLPYSDNASNYQQSEGGIDYNAGLVSALGYIISATNPVDVNKFKSFEQVPVPALVAVEEKDALSNDLVVAPNPAAVNFTITSPHVLDVLIYNNVGQLVKEFEISGIQTFGENFNAGIYHVVFSKNGRTIKSITVSKE